MAIVRAREAYHERATEEMAKHLLTPDWNLRQKIALSCRILADEGLATSNARLMEASRLKSQFLANMSHELRTPLNSIIGFSKVLLNRMDGDLTERQEAYVRSVHNSSRHLLELITGILDFSRIESGKFEMRQEKVDLLDVVEECIETSLPLVRDKRMKLEKDVRERASGNGKVERPPQLGPERPEPTS